MPDRAEFIEALLAGIAEGTPVDWDDLERSAASDSLRDEIREIRVIAGVADIGLSSLKEAPGIPYLTTWGHLKLIERIGEGAFGVVYRAWDSRLDRQVALKLLKDPVCSTDGGSSVIEEGRLLARVRHPGVVTVHGAERIGDRVGIWMELVEGQSLDQIVSTSGPIAMDEGVRMTVAVSRALHAVHTAGLIHRDITARNIVREPSGRTVLMDFGTGAEPASNQRSLPSLAGTPLYLAPEVIAGGRSTVQSDIYSVGVLLYYLLTGTHPVRGATLSELRRGHQQGATVKFSLVPPGLRQCLARALASDPRARFASAEDFAEALSAAFGTYQPLPTQPSTRGLLSLAGVAVLVAMLTWVARGPGDVASVEFQRRDWVLVTPFENRTGDLLVGRQVDAAFARELTSSGFVNLVPTARVDDVLRMMERKVGSPLTPAIAREVALRDGGIRAIIFGSIEKTGAGLMLTAGVLDPSSNVQVFERRQAVRNDALVHGVRRLSNDLRVSFGEARGRIRESNQQLEAVTTQSLQALTLYSEAYRLGTQRDARSWEGARALATQALELDPEFPAARIWLAWSYSRQNRVAEARVQAKLAFDGAARATEWEQHWIRGSYHYICDDYAAAALEYEALLRLRPDDFWGVWNLSVAYTRLGRLTDAVNLVAAVSATRPHDLIAQGWAVNAHIGAGHRAGATPYMRRIADLVNGRDDDERAQYWPLTALHDAHLAIERHDAVTAADLLDSATSDLLQAKPLLRLHGGWSLALAYLGIGRVKEARRAAALIPHDEFRRVLVARIALAAGAVRETREILRPFTIERFFSTSPDFARSAVQMSLWTMVKAGLADETEQQLAAWQEAAVPQPLGHQVEALQARTARLRGAEVEAERGLRAALSWVGLSPLNIVRYSEPLADILRQRGDLIGEQAVLERAINLSTRFADTPYDVSLPMRLRLAGVLRQRGETASAERIEDELSSLLALADPDFPTLVALERQRRSKARQ